MERHMAVILAARIAVDSGVLRIGAKGAVQREGRIEPWKRQLESVRIEYGRGTGRVEECTDGLVQKISVNAPIPGIKLVLILLSRQEFISDRGMVACAEYRAF